MEYWAIIELFLTENAVVLGAGTSVLAIVELIFSPFRTFARKFQKPQKVVLVGSQAPSPLPTIPIITMSLDDFHKKLDEREAEVRKELETASADEVEVLNRQLADLENKRANPDKALQEAKEQIAKLETLLERTGNDIGGDRLAKARTALEAGDYSIADDIFAEVEARADLEVQSAARAAYGRGEIAEAEIRWADAATHYSKAARLDPTCDTLNKAGEFLLRAGQHKQAIKIQQDSVDLAQQQYGEADEKTATALNNLANSYSSECNYLAAEPLYREALEIDAKTIGTNHPNYATHLYNLAFLIQSKGDYVTAEQYYREVLAIDGKTIGTSHPDHSNHLNNLAFLMQLKGDYVTAERLYREVLTIDANTIGTDHPSYATHLNNLAGLLHAIGDLDGAESIYREVLVIDAKTIGVKSKDYAIDLNNLAGVLQYKGDFDGAKPLFHKAAQVIEAALGAEHPDSKVLRENLEVFFQMRNKS